MRGSTLEGMLLYEAKIKPSIRDMVDRVHEMSHQDIDQLQVPLPWFKLALKQLKNKESTVDQEARILANTTFGETKDVMGSIVQWTGSTTFIPLSHAMKLEVTSGTWIFLPDVGGMWIGSSYSKTADAALTQLPTHKRSSRREYIAFTKGSPST